MGTTAQKLQAVANSKAAIKAAIEAKGVSDVGNVLSTYATKIASIPVGGGDPRYEVTAQGALNKKSFVIDWFDDLTSIPNYGLENAYYGSNVTSASFPNVTSVGTNGLQNAFYNCTALTSVDLSSLTSVGINGLQNAFYNCTSLTSVDLSSLTSVGINGFPNAFMGCTSLASIDLSKVTTVGTGGLSQFLRGCTSLTSVDLSKVTTVGNSGLQYAFLQCAYLKNVYLSSLSSTTATNATVGTFSACSRLELVDLSEATAIPAIDTTTFQNTNTTFKIVVPNALYDSWKAATNWSTYANQIVKAEQGLKFTAAQAGSTITLNAVGTPPSISLMYSTDDGKTFNAYTVGTTITLANVGDSVRFKAGSGGNTAFASDDSNYHQFVMTGNISYSSPMESLWWLLDPMGIAPSSFARKAFMQLFKDCGVLHGEFDFSIFTTIPTDALRETFKNCTNMTGLDLSSCTSLNLNQSFRSTGITYVDASNATTGAFNYAFAWCYSLTTANLSKITNAGDWVLSDTFRGCSALKTVYLSKLKSAGASYGLYETFKDCRALELVDFSQAEAVPALATIDTFANTNNTYKIVVPDALYNDWIAASNWSDSSIVGHIVKVSDYTPTI